MQQNFRFSFLSGNVIKILAAIFMAIDHIGLVFWPQNMVLFALGRLSMPLFAFMIAEGAHYTKNKLKYIALIFLLGSCCQVVLYIVEQSFYLGILITFSISIATIYSLQYFKKKLFSGKAIEKICSLLIFVGCIVLSFFLNEWFEIDYGFWGCMLPVFASILRIDNLSYKGDGWWNRQSKLLNGVPINLLTFSIGLILLCVFCRDKIGIIQFYSLLSLPILFLYSGRRGKLKLKYFFYVFYPVHLAIIYGISMLI